MRVLVGRLKYRAFGPSSPVGFRVLGAATLAFHVSACEVPKYSGDRGLDAGATGHSDPPAPSDTSNTHDAAASADSSRTPSGARPDGAIVEHNEASPKAPDAGAENPQPAADAGTDTSAVRSDDAVQDGGLPAWASPLLGTYVKRSTDFSYDDNTPPPINTRNVEHSLVKVVQNGSALEWTVQLCSYVVSIKGSPGTTPLSLLNTVAYPPLKGRLVLGKAGTFSSTPMLQHLGFDPARGSGCDMGNVRPKFDDQTWISGATCTCYGTSVPEHVNDCRVIDTDGDGKPGIFARGASPLGTTVSDYAMVFDYSVTIVDGKVMPGRAHELREVRAQQPACINAAVDACSVGNNQLCPGTTTRLLPVDDAVTCATLNTGDFGPAEPFPAETDCRATPGR